MGGGDRHHSGVRSERTRARSSAGSALSYSEFNELPERSVPGHAGRFVLKQTHGKPIVYAQGRIHLYEGHSAREVSAGVRVLAAAGIKRLILTNAAGSLNENFSPGSWMLITDHINLTGVSPLVGTSRSDVQDAAARRPYQRAQFVDMTETYSKQWRTEFTRAAESQGLILHKGVYAGLLGPQYETPAEVRMLRQLGADAIGMSTVLEAIQARALRLEVAGFSCLTNWGAGLGSGSPSHEEVLETGKAAANIFSRLLDACLVPAKPPNGK